MRVNVAAADMSVALQARRVRCRSIGNHRCNHNNRYGNQLAVVTRMSAATVLHVRACRHAPCSAPLYAAAARSRRARCSHARVPRAVARVAAACRRTHARAPRAMRYAIGGGTTARRSVVALPRRDDAPYAPAATMRDSQREENATNTVNDVKRAAAVG